MNEHGRPELVDPALWSGIAEATTIAAASFIGGVVIVYLLRLLGLRWTWGFSIAALVPLVGLLGLWGGIALGTVALAHLAYGVGRKYRRGDWDPEPLGPWHTFTRLVWPRVARDRPSSLVIGYERRTGRPCMIPRSTEEGIQHLVLGATGTGKTSLAALLVGLHIRFGSAAVVVAPKHDRVLRGAVESAARDVGRRFVVWTTRGPTRWNTFAQGEPDEVADKALVGEIFTEPFHERVQKRYLGHEVRTLRSAGVWPATPGSLLRYAEPEELEVLVDGQGEQDGELPRYLDSLDRRALESIGSLRDRLGVIVERQAGAWIEPAPGEPVLDLYKEIRSGSVVYFELDAARQEETARLLAGALVEDLIAISDRLQYSPVPCAVCIDELGLLGAARVLRLYQAARSAGISVIALTQSRADLMTACHAAGLEPDQLVDNLNVLVSLRQASPESADYVARLLGTPDRVIRTHHTSGFGVPSGRGTMTPGRAFHVHPETIKSLRRGEAAVRVFGTGQMPLLIRTRRSA